MARLLSYRSSDGSPPSRRSLAGFARDASGDISLMFGLLAVAMFLFIGGAVDVGRWMHARTQTIAALDAAVLAGARVLQLDADNSAGATQAAEAFYTENTKTRIPLETDTIAFQATDDGMAFTATGNAYIKTPFLSLASIDRLPLVKLSGAEYSKAVLAVGGNAEQSIEISMMLDITGSMGGQKILDLKDAAKDLIDIVVWEDQGEHTSKVALAPFSAAVDAGSLSPSVAQAPSSSVTFNFRDGYNRTWKKTSSCVSERQGAAAFTDATPTGANKLPAVYTSSGGCSITNPVIPLSNDKTSLKAAIDGYVASGTTAGHLGTAWAWYLLSPNWASVLPSNSRPANYGTSDTQKIAILMTDGDYNMQYCNNSSTTGASAPDRNANGYSSSKLSCTAANGSSTTQARTLCTNMKAAGITVYTVGFEIASGSTPDTTMQQCATSPGHYYSAQSGEQLKQAFRDIALKISSLYLSR
ncbi:MAG: TadE/TadG family type IV pilus assembly protein [Pseudomonadota bacterium]